MLDTAVAAGAELVIGNVVGIETAPMDSGSGEEEPQRRVTGVRYLKGAVDEGQQGTGEQQQDVTIAASHVVVAMGPWSVLAEDWLNGEGFAHELRVPMEGVKSTSIVYSSEEVRVRVTAEPFALFCAEDANGCHMEVYPR